MLCYAEFKYKMFNTHYYVFFFIHTLIYNIYVDGTTVIESMAILQYLEDTRPNPSLQPNTPLERARMREICEVSH